MSSTTLSPEAPSGFVVTLLAHPGPGRISAGPLPCQTGAGKPKFLGVSEYSFKREAAEVFHRIQLFHAKLDSESSWFLDLFPRVKMSKGSALVWNASGRRCAPQREMSCLFIPAVHNSVTGSRKSALILTASSAKFSYLDSGYQSSLSACPWVGFSLLPEKQGFVFCL